MDILIIIATIIVLFILVASAKSREHFTTSSSDSLHVTVHVRYEYYNMFCREPDAKVYHQK